MDWEGLAQTVIRGKANSLFGVVWVEPDGQVMCLNGRPMHNKKATEVFGIEPFVEKPAPGGKKIQEFVGYEILRIHPPEVQTQARAEWFKVAPPGQSWTVTLPVIRKADGQPKPTEIRLTTIYCNGKSIGNFAGLKEADGAPWHAFDAETLAAASILEGFSPAEILDNGLIAGMAVVGDRFKRNEIYVPEVLISARAMKAGMAFLEPMIVKSGMKPIGKVVMGTVKGDLHDIGKNLVCMMLQGAGFEIIDLGVDAGFDKFVKACTESGAKLAGCSALLTTTMPHMAKVVDAFHVQHTPLGVRVMIGGAPVTQSYADEIQADGYAPDAASAVELAKKLYGVG